MFNLSQTSQLGPDAQSLSHISCHIPPTPTPIHSRNSGLKLITQLRGERTLPFFHPWRGLAVVAMAEHVDQREPVVEGNRGRKIEPKDVLVAVLDALREEVVLGELHLGQRVEL